MLDARAGCVSEEVALRGIAAETRVRVQVEVLAGRELPMAALVEEGGAFDFLAEEPDLYTDADALERKA